MKKRILSMLLVATLITSIFTGCGAGGSSKEITVSEMLDSILEENGEVVMYTFAKDGDSWTEDYTPSKNRHVVCHKYDNKTETITTMIPSSTGKYANPLGDYLDGTCVADKECTYIDEIYKDECNQPDDMTLVVDEDGNVLYEVFDNADVVRFGEFSRKEINGVSCMVFATYQFKTENAAEGVGRRNSVFYTIIADTDFTMDKTVVCDSTDVEGITTKTWKSKERKINTQDRNWTPNN